VGAASRRCTFIPARISSSDKRSPDGPAPTTTTYDGYEYIRQHTCPSVASSPCQMLVSSRLWPLFSHDYMLLRSGKSRNMYNSSWRFQQLSYQHFSQEDLEAPHRSPIHKTRNSRRPYTHLPRFFCWTWSCACPSYPGEAERDLNVGHAGQQAPRLTHSRIMETGCQKLLEPLGSDLFDLAAVWA
jgi:hypothetical protein